MSYSFNPPPQWPKPPEGWEPGPGWQPDPAWGPAPEGWNFWVDENGDPVASGDGPAQDAQPPQESADPRGSATPPTEPLGSMAPESSTAPEGSTALPTEPLGAQPPQGSTVPPAGSQGSTAPQGGAVPEGAAPSSGTAGPGAGPGDIGTGAGAAGVGTGAIGAGAGAAGSSAGGPPPGGPGGPYQGGPGNPPGGPGSGNGGEPARKKNFFTSGAGIAVLGSGLVLILIIVVVVMMTTGVFGGKQQDPAPADSSSSSSPAATSEASGSSEAEASSPAASSAAASSASASSGQAAPTARGIPAHETKPVKTLSGTGDKTVDAGLSAGTIYYVEYTYSGKSNFALWGKNKDGERSGLLANEIYATSGSHWVNADDLYQDVTGFSVQAGTGEKWELKVFTGESLAFEAGQSYDLSGSQAVSYADDEAKKATLKNTSDTTLMVEARDVQGKSLSHAMVAAGQSATVDLPASSEDKPTLIQVEAQNVKDEWSFSTE